MKLDTAGIQAFVAIVDHGTFQKAGHFLSLSQTGLSRRLQHLEAQLGTRLIDRTTRNWSLTSVGNEFLPKARRLIHELESAILEVRDATKHHRGAVTVACVATAALHFLPEIIQRYSRRFQGNRIKILDSIAPEVTDAVLQRRAEFGINVMTRRHQELDAVPLMQDPFVLACRDDHPLSKRSKVKWRDLEDHNMILLGHGSGNGFILDYALTKLKVGLAGLYETQRPSTALSLVSAGLGAVILPRLTLRKDAYPRICTIPLEDPVLQRELGLIKRKDATLSPAGEQLYDMIARAFKRGR